MEENLHLLKFDNYSEVRIDLIVADIQNEVGWGQDLGGAFDESVEYRFPNGLTDEERADLLRRLNEDDDYIWLSEDLI